MLGGRVNNWRGKLGGFSMGDDGRTVLVSIISDLNGAPVLYRGEVEHDAPIHRGLAGTYNGDRVVFSGRFKSRSGGPAVVLGSGDKIYSMQSEGVLKKLEFVIELDKINKVPYYTITDWLGSIF